MFLYPNYNDSLDNDDTYKLKLPLVHYKTLADDQLSSACVLQYHLIPSADELKLKPQLFFIDGNVFQCPKILLYSLNFLGFEIPSKFVTISTRFGLFVPQRHHGPSSAPQNTWLASICLCKLIHECTLVVNYNLIISIMPFDQWSFPNQWRCSWSRRSICSSHHLRAFLKSFSVILIELADSIHKLEHRISRKVSSGGNSLQHGTCATFQFVGHCTTGIWN